MSVKILVGKIVSNKMQKTVVVQIERKIQHPVYKKFIKKTKRIKADSGDMKLNIGQTVKISETRPMGKEKNFKVTEKMKE